ncbi:MAG TPA: ABC transporter permease, partial [Cyclobacteriaceae bacterium]|nr:ABC transporter permease [Cyclobacteriaceae bacterium]
MQHRSRPSRFFLRLLRWYCKPALLERIEGDLTEAYYDQVKKSGKRKADFRFAIEIILLFRPAIIKPIKLYSNSYNYMTRNYFNVAWRNLLRSKTFSLINIGGLSLGVTCSLLIFLWINDEMHVDAFNSNEDLYSVYERVFPEGRIDAGPWTPGELAAELKQRFPEIKYASGLWNHESDALFSLDDKRLNFRGCAADSDFFSMFNYTLLHGSAANALRSPNDITISRKMADAFFGSPAAAYGNTIRMNNNKDFRITAVFENLPANASQQFDFVTNWQDLLTSVSWLKVWIYRGPFTYIQLQSGVDPSSFELRIKDFLNQFISADSRQGYRAELGLQPYNEMYLHSNFENGVPAGGRIEYVKLFGLIALFILLIACINFMNLSTARSIKRAKEVGVRKTMGAFRSYLVSQFIGEAMLLTFVAMVLALVFTALTLPYFNIITNKFLTL